MMSKEYLADEETVKKAVEKVSKILPSKYIFILLVLSVITFVYP